MTDLMKGKRGIIMGLANDKSIAYGLTKALINAGSEVALTYQGEALLKRVQPIASEMGIDKFFECDVTDEAAMDATFAKIKAAWGHIDFLVHAIGFSDKNELKGAYLNTTRANFLNTIDISCFSFTAVAARAAEMMSAGSSMLTLTYQGAERVFPNYNVMGVAKAALEASVMYLANDLGPRGIRVNALSAGPIRTLAASGIGDFKTMLKYNELVAPLRRNVTIDEVGQTGLYLLSDMSSGVTGENVHVDSGYQLVGMPGFDEAEALGELYSGQAS